MNNQNQAEQNNNNRRFNNRFHLDPDKEDILIEKIMDKDIFCPILSMTENFGINNDYYSIRTVEPLKESFFHAMQALFFPNATWFQISMIMCYVIIIVFIILLCFGLDETNSRIFLEVKLSTVDNIGSFYPKKIRKNFLEWYRVFTYHFLHYNLTHLLYNVISLMTFCSFFEALVKKHIFILVFFLTGILTNIEAINIFQEDERFCGINNCISGILGAFVMLFFMNWEETKIIFTPIGKFLSLYLLFVYLFFNALALDISTFGNISINLISLYNGAIIFALIAKPIRIHKWKVFIRIFSGIFLLTMSIISLLNFYLKETPYN